MFIKDYKIEVMIQFNPDNTLENLFQANSLQISCIFIFLTIASAMLF